MSDDQNKYVPQDSDANPPPSRPPSPVISYDFPVRTLDSRLKRVERVTQYRKRGVISPVLNPGNNKFRTVAASNLDDEGNIIVGSSSSTTTVTESVGQSTSIGQVAATLATGAGGLAQSAAPLQLPTIPYTVSSTGVTFTWSGISLLFSDGTTLVIPDGSLTYSGLTASTTYYTYWYVNSSDGTLGQTNANPPSSTPSSLLLAQCGLVGRLGIGLIKFTTTSSGSSGGTGGGGDTCPEGAELVEIQGKGSVRAIDVVAGDFIKGKSFQSGEDVFRKVLQVTRVSCAAWRIVDGHRVSPCEAVYGDGQWMPAFRVPGSTFDEFMGTKVLISVESDEYNEQNYWLTGGNPLLIHNFNGYNPC